MSALNVIKTIIRCLEAVESVLLNGGTAAAVPKPQPVSSAPPAAPLRPAPTITQGQVDAARKIVAETPRGNPNQDALKRAERIHNRLSQMISDEGIDVSLGMIDYYIAERMINFMVTLAEPTKTERRICTVSQSEPVSTAADEESDDDAEDEASGEPSDNDLVDTNWLIANTVITGGTLTLWLSEGLPKHKVGRVNYYRLREVKAWLREQIANGRRFRSKLTHFAES